jgi:hypothetical protein
VRRAGKGNKNRARRVNRLWTVRRASRILQCCLRVLLLPLLSRRVRECGCWRRRRHNRTNYAALVRTKSHASITRRCATSVPITATGARMAPRFRLRKERPARKVEAQPPSGQRARDADSTHDVSSRRQRHLATSAASRPLFPPPAPRTTPPFLLCALRPAQEQAAAPPLHIPPPVVRRRNRRTRKTKHTQRKKQDRERRERKRRVRRAHL